MEKREGWREREGMEKGRMKSEGWRGRRDGGRRRRERKDGGGRMGKEIWRGKDGKRDPVGG